MEIIQADQSHEAIALELLDQFRTHCKQIISPADNFISDTAKKTGSSLFRDVVRSDRSVIYLARDGGEYLGIITIHAIPQIRKGCLTGEIEEMFVSPRYHGMGVATELMDKVIHWAKEKGIESIRLESSNELERAHGFYKKYGFHEYGKAFFLRLE